MTILARNSAGSARRPNFVIRRGAFSASISPPRMRYGSCMMRLAVATPKKSSIGAATNPERKRPQRFLRHSRANEIYGRLETGRGEPISRDMELVFHSIGSDERGGFNRPCASERPCTSRGILHPHDTHPD